MKDWLAFLWLVAACGQLIGAIHWFQTGRYLMGVLVIFAGICAGACFCLRLREINAKDER